MKSVTQLMATTKNEPPARIALHDDLVITQDTVEVVNDLFRRLRGIFPAWRQAWPSTEALAASKEEWITGFAEEGIRSIEQIEFGIQNCRKLKKPFAPSVGEFIAMCQPTPEDLGIPPMPKALAEALENFHPSRAGSRTWSHAAVHHAALQCEAYNLGDMKPEQAEKVFARAYDITIRMLVAGEPLGDIATGIGHDSQKSLAQLADDYASQKQTRLLEIQQIPTGAAQCRAHLLAKLNIKRAGQPAGEGV